MPTLTPPASVDLAVFHLVHRAARRDLARFVAAVRDTPLSDRAAWRRLAARWDLLVAVLGHQHGAERAGLWPALRVRVPESEAGVLDAMDAQQAALASQLVVCSAGFARLPEHADPDARAALAVRLVAVQGAVERHLEHKEADALPLLQRLMTPGEWRVVDDEFFVAPMTPRHAVRLVPWVAHGVPTAELEPALRLAGPRFRAVWWATRGGFAARERRTFRHG